MKLILTAVGAAFEFTGVVLVAAPEIFPRAFMARRALGARRAELWAWARRHMGLGQHQHVYVKAGGATAGGAAGAWGFATVGKDASPEQKFAFLLEHVEKTERRFNQIEGRLAGIPREWQDDIRAAREEIESMIEKRIEDVRDARIRIRLVGIAFLLAGVPILATANLV